MGRLLATLATILILVLGAAFAVPAFVDWNEYRSGIEKTASAILGRKVSILGDIDIVLLPEPHIRAANIAAGNGKADGALVTASAVDISLSLQAILGGRLEASKLKLVRPELTLDFTKPFLQPETAATDGAFALSAEVKSIEIEAGRISVFSRSRAGAEALALTKISGSVSASPQGGGYRFAGRLTQNGRQYEVKLSAAPDPEKGVRLAGNAVDTASKASLQADGLLNAAEDPSFEGALALSLPQGAGRLPFEVQVKSAAKIGFAQAALDDLSLTLDEQNRPQVFAGSAKLDFDAKSASIALQASALDADALASAPAGRGAVMGVAAPAEWSRLRSALGTFLWLYPEYALSLSFEAGQIQLKGEPVEGILVHGTRTPQRWFFEQAQAALPGGTSVKLAGTLTGEGSASRLIATAALEGKNLGRLYRWLIPSGPGGTRAPAGPFAVQGSLTLSNEVSAFEGVSGNLDGIPFTASLHFDKAPVRKLQLALAGDNFDLSSVESGQENAAALSPDSFKEVWQGGVAKVAAMLGGDPQGFDTADVDISAGGIKTSTAEAKNVAIHIKFDKDLITVSKLNAETAGGLVLRGEGAVPLRGTGQGRFDGRLEARSPQAIVQFAGLAGAGRGSFERRAADMAPAALSISYSNDAAAGTATALLLGNLGPARVECHAQLKGPLSDWRTGQLSTQLKISEPDSNKLVALLFPDAVLAPGASPPPGALAVSLNGVSEQLETSATLTAGVLQVQLDGVTGIKAQSIGFKGKAAASSQTPEQFLPNSLLALLGGEPKANLSLSANLAAAPGRFDADELIAETQKNLVTGHLSIETRGGVTRADANLKADKASLPALLGYFLSGTPADGVALAVPATLGAPPPLPDIWSGRPFSMPAFQETAGKISLVARALKLSDALVLTDAQFHANLDKGRLDIEDLRGKTLGGSFDASVSLTAKGAAVSGEAEISAGGADLALLAAPGTPPVVTGQGSLSLFVSGQGLSPRGLISELQGRGTVRLSGGTLAKMSPAAVQTVAEELLAEQLPLTEGTVTNKVLAAIQTGDFGFRRLKIPVKVADGILEIRRASFRGAEGTVRMEGYADLNKAQVDSTWQMGVSSDRRHKWPPVKILLSGPLRELGARPKTLAGEDFVRAILVRKMEGDINRLESLNKPNAQLPAPPNKSSAAAPGWTATQESAPQKSRRRKSEKVKPEEKPATQAPPARSFEQRMRDALENGTSAPAAR